MDIDCGDMRFGKGIGQHECLRAGPAATNIKHRRLVCKRTAYRRRSARARRIARPLAR